MFLKLTVQLAAGTGSVVLRILIRIWIRQLNFNVDPYMLYVTLVRRSAKKILISLKHTSHPTLHVTESRNSPCLESLTPLAVRQDGE
jgi:hypothetical protein